MSCSARSAPATVSMERACSPSAIHLHQQDHYPTLWASLTPSSAYTAHHALRPDVHTVQGARAMKLQLVLTIWTSAVVQSIMLGPVHQLSDCM